MDIQIFACDPLEYHFLLSSFGEAVEHKIGEQRKHCIQQASETGYRLRTSLLEDQASHSFFPMFVL